MKEIYEWRDQQAARLNAAGWLRETVRAIEARQRRDEVTLELVRAELAGLEGESEY